MVEVAVGHVTLGTDYESGVDTSNLRMSTVTTTEDDETAVLIKHVEHERKVVSTSAVVTVVILTAINLLNYMDRCTIAGQSQAVASHSSRLVR